MEVEISPLCPKCRTNLKEEGAITKVKLRIEVECFNCGYTFPFQEVVYSHKDTLLLKALVNINKN